MKVQLASCLSVVAKGATALINGKDDLLLLASAH